ncbi:MAG: hypothetical protein MI919_17080 [Holophagales bacterium]|nr:hypothetical protein [Holophagales bacterium]
MSSAGPTEEDVEKAAQEAADGASEERRRRSARFHARWLKLNLALLALLIVATLWQFAAIKSCSRRAQLACENAGGIRLFRTVGFGPWMSCYYECQEAEQVARAGSLARAGRAVVGSMPRLACEPGLGLESGAVPAVGETLPTSRGGIGPLDTAYAQN